MANYVSGLYNIYHAMQNGGNMYKLIKIEMNDDGQKHIFTLYQSDNADDMQRVWENTLDKLGLEIIED